MNLLKDCGAEAARAPFKVLEGKHLYEASEGLV